MEQLKERDLRQTLSFIRDLYAQPDLDAFAHHVVDRLTEIVDGNRFSYNEAHVRHGTLRVFTRPADQIPPLGARHYREHPMMQRFVRTGDGRAYKFSDFMTRARLHATAMYQDHYRGAGVEHQTTICLGSPTPHVVAFAIGRDVRDFSERDRLVLNLLRPHLATAYARAAANARLHAQMAVLAQAADTAAAAIIVLSRDNRVDFCTRRAREWLREYFPSQGRTAPRRLPAEVADWLKHQAAAEDAPAIAAPPRPLTITRDDRCLVIRLVGGPGERALLLEESRAAFGPEMLAPLGLSPREREVLALVARGIGNDGIAQALGARPRTVAKHMERIHRKLGVENRAAAAVRAHELAAAVRESG